MRKILTSLIASLILITGCQSAAQELKAGLYGGYGSYNLKNLKAFQDEISNYPNLPPLSQTASFPGYLTYSGVFWHSPQKTSPNWYLTSVINSPVPAVFTEIIRDITA
ncbi:MAG: hypothetical protein AB2L17_07875 [Lentimicrobium sp.]